MKEKTPEQLGEWSREEHADVVGYRIQRDTKCDDLHAAYAAKMAWAMVASHVAQDGPRLAHPAHEQAEDIARDWARSSARGVTGGELERLENEAHDKFWRTMNDPQFRAEWTAHLDQCEREGDPQPSPDPELLAEERAIEQAEEMGIAQYEAAELADDDGPTLEDALAGGDVREVWEHLEEAYGNISMREAEDMLTRYQAEQDGARLTISPKAAAAINQLATILPAVDREPSEADVTHHMMTGEEPRSWTLDDLKRDRASSGEKAAGQQAAAVRDASAARRDAQRRDYGMER